MGCVDLFKMYLLHVFIYLFNRMMLFIINVLTLAEVEESLFVLFLEKKTEHKAERRHFFFFYFVDFCFCTVIYPQFCKGTSANRTSDQLFSDRKQ